MAMSLVILISLSFFAGCAKNRNLVIHPLAKDFRLVKAGETVTAEKDGALVSNFFLQNLAEVQVEE